jgi:hypothetical protein
MITKLLSTFALVCIAITCFYGAAAQGGGNAGDVEMEKLFSDKAQHGSYRLKVRNTTTNSYWIANDSLYSCISAEKGDGLIALADIDFTKSTITMADDWYVDGTKDPLYKMELIPLMGKPTFTFWCLFASIMVKGEMHLDKTVVLDMASNRIARKAMEYLKLRSTGKAGPATPGNEFDSQLGKLINGLKDNYAGMQGSRVDNQEVNCTISLEGAVNTRIYTGMLRNVWLNAAYGEFDTQAAAEATYKRLVERINNSKGLPCPMIKQDENVSETVRTQVWLPFDVNNVLDKSMKDFYIQVDLLKLPKIDKDNKVVYFWSVILRIKR